MSEIEANTPYVYYAEDGEYNVNSAMTTTLEAKASALTIQNDEGWLLKGVYRQSTVLSKKKCGIMTVMQATSLSWTAITSKTEALAGAMENFSIMPFRAYFTATNESGSNRYEISIYDELTAVRSLEESSADTLSICKMEGKELSSLQKGIYIVKFSTSKSGKIIINKIRQGKRIILPRHFASCRFTLIISSVRVAHTQLKERQAESREEAESRRFNRTLLWDDINNTAN